MLWCHESQIAEEIAPYVEALIDAAFSKQRGICDFHSKHLQHLPSTPPRWLRCEYSCLGIKHWSIVPRYNSSWLTVEATPSSASFYRDAAMLSDMKSPNSPPWTEKTFHPLIPLTSSTIVQATAILTRGCRTLCYVSPNWRSIRGKFDQHETYGGYVWPLQICRWHPWPG